MRPLLPRGWRRSVDVLPSAVGRVVDRELCTGCGGCVQLDDRITMGDVRGFRRPIVDPGAGARDTRAAARTFRRMCPGISVTAPRPDGARRDRTLGPVLALRRAWAVAPEVRHAGSSGGTLTALVGWLVERDGSGPCVASSGGASDPRTTVPVRITTRDEAFATAGSRYAPVSVAAHPATTDPAATVVCKPCEASALRRLAEIEGREPPLLLTFFCAGTPSQRATDDLVTTLGMPAEAVLESVRYRGRGWPGRFVARSVDGAEVSTDYRTSWGAHLGPHVQWRCRTCPDGVGESGDLSAGDLWDTDDEGYPSFAEAPGTSALVVRTARGRALLDEAVAAGVLEVEPVEAETVVAAQPYQAHRRRLLLPRLVATLVLRRAVTRARGFGILGSAARAPRAALRELRGTVVRLRYRDREGIRS
ncbi:Coenzyme F420 hydrogenase/dehydrogenase, beta subunit C-terminal domain [uncultured Phycicoccus sp.]|uniref:Coenzyme F420 hydrogenase/dehydrogenase, beta subunit C-terminal domain n=1 Tax=uncultured Phycicoccus sp. TaxID=661422 RepID=UPI002614B558|nr:Coenzyme F420 hydrogenase/dehydrogenase, beta subunit C-terminal domain [uncultured Phycicoccus sp.]